MAHAGDLSPSNSRTSGRPVTGVPSVPPANPLSILSSGGQFIQAESPPSHPGCVARPRRIPPHGKTGPTGSMIQPIPPPHKQDPPVGWRRQVSGVEGYPQLLSRISRSATPTVPSRSRSAGQVSGRSGHGPQLPSRINRSVTPTESLPSRSPRSETAAR